MQRNVRNLALDTTQLFFRQQTTTTNYENSLQFIYGGRI